MEYSYYKNCKNQEYYQSVYISPFSYGILCIDTQKSTESYKIETQDNYEKFVKNPNIVPIDFQEFIEQQERYILTPQKREDLLKEYHDICFNYFSNRKKAVKEVNSYNNAERDIFLSETEKKYNVETYRVKYKKTEEEVLDKPSKQLLFNEARNQACYENLTTQ